jgi:hypothetical protein
MTEQATEKVKALIGFVDDNFKYSPTRNRFRFAMPAILILIMLFVIVFLMIYEWTNIPLLSWTPGVVSIIAILISFTSYVKSSVQSVNKEITFSIAKMLRKKLSDKSDETFYLLVPLVAIKQNNFPIKLSILYEINKENFKPEKLAEYYFK